ncbi:hypothetical protein [Treponema putidum]|uniref:Lipoprotein n=1 Tax=Treponema putidum TaxID=221027 RepID=A0AAE9MUD1_9SPIR|nr:hypothetical protein [Treponema putidum]UTY33343.1 hypothetical protein E4N74_04445 [Treponema putidum]
MKHKKFIFFGILILIILASCKQGFVKKVKIKAAPQVKVNLGSKEIKIDNFIDKKSIEEKIKSMGTGLDNIKVYEYGGEGNALHYLIHYPVAAKTIDMSEHITKIKDFTGDSLNKNIDEQKINIHEIKIEKSHVLSNTVIPANAAGGDITLKLPIGSFPEIKPSGENFISAQIAEGKLNISISGANSLPNTIKIDYSGIQVKKNGESEVWKKFTNTKTSDNLIGELDLNNETIESTDRIKIGGKIVITGTIPANYGGSGALTLNIKSDIKKFKEIKIEKDLGNLTYNVNKDLTNLKTIVDWIEFKTISADIQLTNNLPEGNDITINIESNIESTIGDNAHIFKTGQSNTENHTILKKENHKLELAGLSELNFTATLGLSGYDGSSNPNTLTLKNIENNHEYSLSGNITVNFDWNKACIKPKTTNNSIQNNFPENPMDLDIFKENEDLSKILPKPIAAYIYLNSDLIKKKDKPTLKTDVKLKYTKENGTSNSINIIQDGEAKEISFVDKRPDFLTAYSYKTLLSEASLSNESIDIKGIFQDKAEQIQFDASAKLKKIIVTKEALDAIENKTGVNKYKAEFNTDIVFDIQAEAYVSESIKKEIMLIEDILSRKEANDSTNNIINKTKELTLVINYYNQLGVDLKIEILNPDWKESGTHKFKKNILLKPGTNEISIKISKNELREIQNRVPFPIEVNLYFDKESNQKLIKNGTLNFSAYTVANMDINYEF